MARVYLPEVVGGGYGAFWRCRRRYRVVKGGKASKKSSTAAIWFILHLMKMPGANLLVVRQVYRTHLDSTYAQLRWRSGACGWSISGRPARARWSSSTGRQGSGSCSGALTTSTSSRPRRWRRGGCAGCGWRKRMSWTARRNSTGWTCRSRRGEVPAPLFKQTTLTFNPWDGSHWLKKRFFDRPHPDVFTMTSTYRDNEFLDESDHPGVRGDAAAASAAV